MKSLITLLCSFIILTTHSQSLRQDEYKLGAVLFEDNFTARSNNWIIETPSSVNSNITFTGGKLVIDVNAGATVWFDKKLSGNICIEYKRKVIVTGGKNDRLSDLNTFWMANDPSNKNLFTRSGVFSEYDSLLLYYVGIGGNSNTTTRFRKYEGTGERRLLSEHLDKSHLLQPNKEYTIHITVWNGTSRFYVDGVEYFSYTDPNPIPEGYAGFRTVQSRQEIRNFKIYRLE